MQSARRACSGVEAGKDGDLSAMRTRIVTKFDLCTGCRICELICSFVKEGGFNPRYARLRIETTEDSLFNDLVVCIQCDNPACMRVCPTEAIYRDLVTQAIVLDQGICNSCGLCLQHCPIGMIQVNPGTSMPMKCDLCGGDPQCVALCPTGALVLVEILGAE